MAERRMFCRSILESDAFMDMPAESQMLYVHLSMAAVDAVAKKACELVSMINEH